MLWINFEQFLQKNHGGPTDEDRHVGDLGNTDPSDTINDVIYFFDSQVKLSGDPEFSVLGRSIVIHENEDDLGSSGDPSGNSGARIMCCIIKPVEK